jgi:hypothetical protein
MSSFKKSHIALAKREYVSISAVDLAGIMQVAKIFRLVVRAAYSFPQFNFPTAIYRRLPSDKALSHSEFEEEMDLCYLCWWIQAD